MDDFQDRDDLYDWGHNPEEVREYYESERLDDAIKALTGSEPIQGENDGSL